MQNANPPFSRPSFSPQGPISHPTSMTFLPAPCRRSTGCGRTCPILQYGTSIQIGTSPLPALVLLLSYLLPQRDLLPDRGGMDDVFLATFVPVRPLDLNGVYVRVEDRDLAQLLFGLLPTQLCGEDLKFQNFQNSRSPLLNYIELLIVLTIMTISKATKLTTAYQCVSIHAAMADSPSSASSKFLNVASGPEGSTSRQVR